MVRLAVSAVTVSFALLFCCLAARMLPYSGAPMEAVSLKTGLEPGGKDGVSQDAEREIQLAVRNAMRVIF
jgi:hypothetical protein